MATTRCTDLSRLRRVCRLASNDVTEDRAVKYGRLDYKKKHAWTEIDRNEI